MNIHACLKMMHMIQIIMKHIMEVRMILKIFERIINLKPSESDNYHRVQRALECVEI